MALEVDGIGSGWHWKWMALEVDNNSMTPAEAQYYQTLFSQMLQDAQDPQTSARRLCELHRKNGWQWEQARVSDIFQTLAAHPNATGYLLAELTNKHLKAVLSNPSLPQRVREDPGWVKRLASGKALEILQQENVPLPLLQVYAKQPPKGGDDLTRESAQMHVGLAGEAGPDWEAGAREALWDLSGRQELVRLFSLDLLTLDLVPDWLLEPLASHHNAEVRRAAARNPRIPPDVLTLLQRAGSTPDLSRFAPPDLSLPVSALERLARGGEWAKCLAARHPSTPPDVLEHMARLGPSVPGQPKGSGRHRADRGDGEFFRCLVQNPSTPAALRVDIAVAAREKWGLAPAQGLSAPQSEAPASGLLSLEKRRDEWRVRSAQDPQTPAAALTILVQDEVPAVRYWAARNPNTPREALDSPSGSLDDPGCWGCLAVRHPPIPAQTLPAQEPPLKDPAQQAQALEAAALGTGRNGTFLTFLAVLACPDTPVQVLLDGATDRRWPCRFAVARNPVVPLLSLAVPGTEDLLHALTHDGNRFVRAAARAALESVESV